MSKREIRDGGTCIPGFRFAHPGYEASLVRFVVIALTMSSLFEN
jgi:hypothetical protein